MYKHLLLVAALGAVAILPAPASAHGHGPVHPNLVPALDVRIILRDGPKVIHHHHPPHRYLKPQPWPPKIKHYAPRPHWKHHTRHFRWRDSDRHHRFAHDHRKGWAHAPAHRAKFKHRDHRRRH